MPYVLVLLALAIAFGLLAAVLTAIPSIIGLFHRGSFAVEKLRAKTAYNHALPKVRALRVTRDQYTVDYEQLAGLNIHPQRVNQIRVARQDVNRAYVELTVPWNQWVDIWSEGQLHNRSQLRAMAVELSTLESGIDNLSANIIQLSANARALYAAHTTAQTHLQKADASLHQAVALVSQLSEQGFHIGPLLDQCYLARDLHQQAVSVVPLDPRQATEQAAQAQHMLAEVLSQAQALPDSKRRAERALQEFKSEITSVKRRLRPAQRTLTQLSSLYVESCLEHPQQLFQSAKLALDSAQANLPELQSEISMEKQNWTDALEALQHGYQLMQQTGQQLNQVVSFKDTLETAVGRVQVNASGLEAAFEHAWEYCLTFLYDMPGHLLLQLQEQEEHLQTLWMFEGKIDITALARSVHRLQLNVNTLSAQAARHRENAKGSRVRR